MSDDIIKQRFGRYLILDHLVDGGMAKICRARFLGEQADKVVAIKMVQPQFSENPAFKQMFMDEIKLTFGLLHPNIVQTYDYGFYKRQLYVAMEYCDGRNLKQYLDRLKENKYVFPVEISIYIISQVCQGLHYAHTYTNKLTGKAANIIHRDISPHNLMLTYDGAIKIIDFGIAKSNTNSESTQAGTIKGKLSYLAPEYLEGFELDHRYDQFAVGNTLWEMLCSRRLFRAPNDLAVLKKIQECNIPAPSSINPNVPKELDEIVLKAMSKDRSKRFENMDQFNRALIKFLYANYPDFNASDLSYFAKELFKDEIKKDRAKLFEFGKINITPFISEWKKEQDGGSFTSSDIVVPNAGTQIKKPEKKKSKNGVKAKENGESSEHRKENIFEMDSEEDSVINIERADEHSSSSIRNQSLKTSSKRKKSSASKEKEQRLGLNLGESRNVSAAKRDLKKRGDEEKQMTGSRRRRRVESTLTSLTGLNKRQAESAKKIGSIAMIIVGLVVGSYLINNYSSLKGLLSNNERIPSSENKEKNSEQGENNPDNLEKKIKKGKVTFHFPSFDKYKQRLYVNGKPQNVDILNQLEIANNGTFTFRIESPGKKHFIKTITNPTERVKIDVPNMPNEDYAYLYQGAGCRLYGKIYFKLYGENRVESIPLSNRQLGIPFPVNGDNSSKVDIDGNVVFEIYFQNSKKGQNVRTKVLLKLNPNDDIESRISLCDIL